MKLTLTIKMPSYESAKGCCSVLKNAGFNAIVSSSINAVFDVVISCRKEWVNMAEDMYGELKLAETMATDYINTVWSAARAESDIAYPPLVSESRKALANELKQIATRWYSRNGSLAPTPLPKKCK